MINNECRKYCVCATCVYNPHYCVNTPQPCFSADCDICDCDMEVAFCSGYLSIEEVNEKLKSK